MYKVIELIMHKDKLALFQFLKNNPTRALKNEDFYKFLYFVPMTEFLQSFHYTDLIVTITDKQEQEECWEIVRNYPIKIADKDLMDIIKDLECHKLQEQRQGTGLLLNGWIFNAITKGISNEQETALLIRLMFLSGYDFHQVIVMFSSITKRKDLARYFIEYAGRLFKEVEVG